MKLDSLLSLFRAPLDLDAAAREAARDAEVLPPRRPHSSRDESNQRPEADNGGNPVDTVDVSVQATYLLAASQFDPRRMSSVDMRGLADLLFKNGAISTREREILAHGPANEGVIAPDFLASRNFIAEFQESLAAAMGRSSARAVNENSRALAILGRIAAVRERIQ